MNRTTRPARTRAAAPRHVESVRPRLIDVLTLEQVGRLGGIGEALLKHLVPGK
ncbi:hypothetical protein [Streptomyces huiliensis]|uniref:hypothetical protein n=1 Tax=Streptomyces huiliensis TaxID=2876027 RepID=UPI001CBB2E69|nr:hypothetical protein [Streptomyces huiliensis]MBZ4318675.1 hypothetical protein [Streptomyces huiliensis]